MCTPGSLLGTGDTTVNSRDLDPSLPGADDLGCWREVIVTWSGFSSSKMPVKFMFSVRCNGHVMSERAYCQRPAELFIILLGVKRPKSLSPP